MTSQEYLQNEIDRQSPKGRLVSKLGMNDFDPDKFDDIYRQAQQKCGSVFKCEFCGEPYLEKNSRNQTRLCAKCLPGKQTIDYYKQQNKVAVLSEEDCQKIGLSKTTRRGPFKYK